MASRKELEASSIYFVYALIDECSGDIRYIGVSRNLSLRFKEHVRAFKKYGIRLRLVTLTDVVGFAEARRIERIYIAEYERNGAPLLNVEGTENGWRRRWEINVDAKRFWDEFVSRRVTTT